MEQGKAQRDAKRRSGAQRRASGLGRWVREHGMLACALVAAALSMVAVPPSAAYLDYFDWATLGCLFCVLAVAAAFRLMGAFDRLARTIVARALGSRMIALALVLTTGFLSALVTNDVALIVMLPLSAATLIGAGLTRLVPAVFALQGLAANLCGMITPFGNPQNLYLYSYYSLGLGEFLRAMALPFAVSVLGVVAATWVLASPRWTEKARPSDAARKQSAAAQSQVRAVSSLPLSRRRLAGYGVLLAVTLLAVFRLVPVGMAVVVVAAGLFVADRRTLRAVDYPLLLTFACFFVFAGNMARIPLVSEVLGALMGQGPLVVAAGASQVISNVPAAVLLSHFTEAWQPLLVGVNIGGAGTFVGSLASLIVVQHFLSAKKVFPALRTSDAPTTGHFLKTFALLNFAFLGLLVAVCLPLA